MVECFGFVYSEPHRVDLSQQNQVWQRLDQKCMPPRSMGLLERVAVRVAAAQNTLVPHLEPEILIAAGDHGVMAQQVSFSPQSITWQHCLNMSRGGGLIGLFSGKYNLPMRVYDVGVKEDFPELSGIVDCKVAYGTADMTQTAAMSVEQCVRAMQWGRDMVDAVWKRGKNSVIFGEMGIGNTTSASALTAAVLKCDVEHCVGSGTGMGPKALAHKRDVVKRAVELHTDTDNPVELLARLGGYELAFIAGGMLQAAGRGMVILLDGFIVTAAALIADAIDSRVRDYMVACHISNEPGHALQLDFLGLEPILRAGMCLGEGSGAILAWPLVQASLAILNEMNSYDEGQLDNATEALNLAKERDTELVWGAEL